MQGEMNPESIAIGIGTELSKEFVESFSKRVSEAARIRYKKLFPSFQKHLAEMFARNKCVKILCSKDRPVDFSDIYVGSEFSIGDDLFSDEQIAKMVSSNNRIVVSALGGAGKTFLMRFVWLWLFKNEKGRVPVFIEIRKLNSLSSYDLESFVRASAFGADVFPPQAFRHFCENGQIILILDGFDEVVKEKRPELESQIVEFSKRYKETGLIVSGRPDERFDGWQNFHTCKACPFDYKRFKELIVKVPFDSPTKNSFLRIADPDFFKEHNSFLSNPLLAIMMLMTYRDNAEIPANLNTFYENCFATLYSQHDALKESFQREKYLDRSSFKRFFSLFCLFSYIEDKIVLDADDFERFAEKARTYLSMNVDLTEVERDFLENVNALIREGQNYSFIHRSFQEYFSAYAATSVVVENVPRLLSLFARRQGDSTFRLAYEIHPSLVQEQYILPKFDELKSGGFLSIPHAKSARHSALSASGLSIGITFERAVFFHEETEEEVTTISKIEVDWADGVEEFLFTMLAVLGERELNSKIRSASISALTGILKGPNPLDSLPKGVSLKLGVHFDDNDLHHICELSREYKRRPAGVPEMERRARDSFSEMADELEPLLRQANRRVIAGVRKIREDQKQQRETISDFFDV